MSMEAILKALVDSRQQGNTNQGTDPMASMVGSLLGGGQSQGGVNLSDGVDLGDVMGVVGGLMGAAQQSQSTSQQPASGLSGMMGMLESVMGGTQSAASDPVMMLLQPYIPSLAKKANISPEIATIVISFVAHKLLAHHPSSGRDSNSFNLDDMLQQIGTGKIDSSVLHSSGMVSEISKKTGLDEATAEKSLNMAFSLVGQSAAGLIQNNAARPTAKPSAAGAVKSTGSKGNAGTIKK